MPIFYSHRIASHYIYVGMYDIIFTFIYTMARSNKVFSAYTVRRIIIVTTYRHNYYSIAYALAVRAHCRDIATAAEAAAAVQSRSLINLTMAYNTPCRNRTNNCHFGTVQSRAGIHEQVSRERSKQLRVGFRRVVRIRNQ